MYGPELSVSAYIALKRLGWALEEPMTKAMDHIIKLLPSVVDSSKVCPFCEDKSVCRNCVFSLHSTDPAVLAVLALG